VKLLAALPLELALHLLLLHFHPVYVVSAAALAISSTILAVWVVEPAAVRALRTWLNAPTGAAGQHLHEAEALWRVRATIADRPGRLERLAHGFAEHDLNVLAVHVHTLPDRVLDEFILAAPRRLRPDVIGRTVATAGGADVQVWPTTALALADGQTRALTLAVRVRADPGELPLALAALLGARTRPAPGSSAPDHDASAADDSATLHVPAPDGEAVVLERPGEPFTPAETARAHRLAELAGTNAPTEARASRRAVPPSSAR
jgi:hypothetical protein